MRTSFFIVLAALVFVTGSALAIMNNVCKSSHQPWCRSSLQGHTRTVTGP